MMLSRRWPPLRSSRIFSVVFGDYAIDERTLAVECGVHFGLAAFGLWILCSPGVSVAAAIYRPLVELVPEYIVGLMFSGVGLLGVVAIEAGNRTARRLALWPTMFSWIALGVMAWRGAPEAPGNSLFDMLAIGSAWAFVKLGSVRAALDE